MSKAQKNAVKTFTPSTGEEDYIKGGKSLVTNKKPLAKNAQLERALPQMAIEINAAYADGMMLAQRATKTMIEVGVMLNKARTQFASDAKFGQWRKKAIEFSQSHTQRLMQVAVEFGDVPDAELLPVSTLGVLTNASETLKKEVIEEAKDGKVPTRKDVTERKKDEQGSPPVGEKEVTAESMEQGMADDKADVVPPPEEQKEEWEEAQIILDMKFPQRLALLKIEGSRSPHYEACLLYGIPPFYEGQPSYDLVANLYFTLMDQLEKNDPDNTDGMDKVTEAHDILISVIKLAN